MSSRSLGIHNSMKTVHEKVHALKDLMIQFYLELCQKFNFSPFAITINSFIPHSKLLMNFFVLLSLDRVNRKKFAFYVLSILKKNVSVIWLKLWSREKLCNQRYRDRSAGALLKITSIYINLASERLFSGGVYTKLDNFNLYNKIK